MRTHRTANQLTFQALRTRSVVAAFDGGSITSDAGGLLLREIEGRRGFIREFASRFDDFRNQRFVEHSVEELLAQRSFVLCMNYEDLIDHDRLRSDPLLAVMCGKEDPEGPTRRGRRDRGKALAGKSTLNRLETAGGMFDDRPRYKKIVAEMWKLEEYFVDTFLRVTDKKTPRLLVLDFDATDDPLHGKQEGRFFHGYYDCYCYLPLYVFCGDHLLWAQLRKADIDASDGALRYWRC